MTSELALCRAFIDRHPEAAAQALEGMAIAESAAVLEMMPADLAARALAAMRPSAAAERLSRFAPEQAVPALLDLHPGYAAVLLRRLDAEVRFRILEKMPSRPLGLLRDLLAYPAGTAGTVMDTRIFTARDEAAAGATLAALRKRPRQTIEYVFTVDEDHRLTGVAPLPDLLAAGPNDPLSGIAVRPAPRLPATAPRAAILEHPGWQQFHALAVVDATGVLVGAVAHATLRTLLDEDARARPSRAGPLTTVFALGELYWLGLSGVLDGVASAAAGPRPAGGNGVPHADA